MIAPTLSALSSTHTDLLAVPTVAGQGEHTDCTLTWVVSWGCTSHVATTGDASIWKQERSRASLAESHAWGIKLVGWRLTQDFIWVWLNLWWAVDLSLGEYVGKICSEMILKMETTDFGNSPVSLLRLPETKQLKNKKLWELEDGRFCDPAPKKSVWTSLPKTKKQRRWARGLAKTRQGSELQNWPVFLEDLLKSSHFSKHVWSQQIMSG